MKRCFNEVAPSEDNAGALTSRFYNSLKDDDSAAVAIRGIMNKMALNAVHAESSQGKLKATFRLPIQCRELGTSASTATCYSSSDENNDNEDDDDNDSGVDDDEEARNRGSILCKVPMAPPLPIRTLRPPSTSTKNQRILIVDDISSIRSLLNRAFESDGFQVETATNGKFALSMMQNRVYDLVFMDIEMPVMNGYRCTQYIRAWERHVRRNNAQRICALSSHDSAAEQHLATVSGMDEFQRKPAPVRELVDFVRQMLKESAIESEFHIGDNVEVQDHDTTMRLYFGAQISRVHPDQTYDVMFEDTTEELKVAERRIRIPNDCDGAVANNI
eukprot:CAMPEP_0185771552 /NCGR_PEP_ID=MMETSP1174-20130828/64371_1 /TAXON_ID=35687 /ORGANISM="Dictyocha speculum, Strain CCMP1381" /LENGTH=330 /DNA_ID=CAMNT_0028457447 /DNA_START=19 /DNA_END=1011 /DNA_ORIENTATION=+